MSNLLRGKGEALQSVFAGVPGYVGAFGVDHQVAVALADRTLIEEACEKAELVVQSDVGNRRCNVDNEIPESFRDWDQEKALDVWGNEWEPEKGKTVKNIGNVQLQDVMSRS